MYKINYFQKDLTNIDCVSYKMYEKMILGNYIDQPKIFCDKYIVDPLIKIPIFHSYFINQHFHKHYLLTDYDQLSYIESFKFKNCFIVYNSDTQKIDSYQDKYKFIDINEDIITYMEKYYE